MGTLVGADLATSAEAPPPRFATVIPQPLAQTPARGTFVLRPDARIVVRSGGAEALRVARLLAATLRPATGYRLSVSSARGPAPDGSIALALTPGDEGHGAEGYRLVVVGDGVTLTAARAAGLFWGTQTLRQLLPAAIEADTRRPGPWLRDVLPLTVVLPAR